MKTDELRKTYLDFFKSKDHKAYSSDSLVPHDDPSLLFTGAGMNQFKPYFLGLKKDVKRATSCQKCLRTADLDRVGKTAYHHSFFEMLGNFSFGDYFKEEAIEWGWEFVTKVLKLPEDKLWVSVFQEDDEAFNIWKNKIGLNEKKIVRMDAYDNFWPSNAPKDGPNGPCGPCSEIYVGAVPGKGVEIWNLVFTQFDRQSDGSLKNLPQRNIDTGMGLERAASVIQGVESNYDIDSFQKIRAELKALLKSGSNQTAHENAVMDHIRAITFSVADGALPSNEGRGYVIRKLIRLGSDHLQKAGASHSASLHKMVTTIVGVYGSVYPEIVDRQKTIASIVENEEKAYEESCKRAENARQGSMTADEFAFMLYDTFGLPMDKIREKFAKDGMNFDENKFSGYLEEQRNRSRQSSKIAGEIFANKGAYELIDGLAITKFLGYEATKGEGKLLRVLKNQSKTNSLSAGEEGILIFDQTPFYAESGGQIGDQGAVLSNNFKAEVLDTQATDKVVTHKVKVLEGSVVTGTTCELLVNADRRSDIMKNHTATHLLHSALRKVLGDHVKQSGSLVAQDYLRFDFTHFSAVDKNALNKIEELVNGEIQKNITLAKKEMGKDEAVKEGAIAFFGEKYGDKVRVISIGDFSKELCGGTHLNSTGEIELFKIMSESSIQAGVRRIEAVTGRAARTLVQQESQELVSYEKEFKVSQEALPAKIKELSAKVTEKKNTLNRSISAVLRPEFEKMLKNAPDQKGVKVLTASVGQMNSDLLNSAYEYLKTLGIPFTALWQFDSDGKVTFVVAASPDVAKKGFHAGKIVKEVAQIVEGNGGGRPEFAVGGGKNTSKAGEALKAGETLIRGQLN